MVVFVVFFAGTIRHLHRAPDAFEIFSRWWYTKIEIRGERVRGGQKKYNDGIPGVRNTFTCVYLYNQVGCVVPVLRYR